MQAGHAANQTRLYTMKYLVMAAGIAFCGATVSAAGSSFRGFSDNFDSAGKYATDWTIQYDGLPGSVEHVIDGSGNGVVKISSEEKTARGIMHSLTGLRPATAYRVSARVKTQDVADGRGAVIYMNPGTTADQPWNASEFVYGTNDWQTVYMDFVSTDSGTADIVLGLGFPWGTYNGGKAKGTVYWDDVNVSVVPKGSLMEKSGKHVRILIDSEKVTVTDKQLKAWVSDLDKVYESYTRLVGDVPYGGRRLDILTTPGIEPGYWALAGNPILLNNHSKVNEILEKHVSDKDWSFGVTHEIGHTFNAGSMGKTDYWNWNDELFANFRMSYALEQLGGTVSQDASYKGRDIINYYKKDYDKTIGAGKASVSGDALHYTFLRIKEKYGWKVFEQAFRKLYALERDGSEGNMTNRDKFYLFLRHVSDAAGEDVTKTTYTENELQLINKGFEQ